MGIIQSWMVKNPSSREASDSADDKKRTAESTSKDQTVVSDCVSGRKKDGKTTSEDKKNSIPERKRTKKEYDKFRSYLTADHEEKVKEAIRNNGSHGLNRFIEENKQTWKEKKMKVAVTGNMCMGKSTLINALRGLKPTDKGAAKVGVTETTKTCTEYPFPKNKYVTLCDLPGLGSQTFTKANYVKKTDLETFDVVLIVLSDDVSENDEWIAQQALDLSKNVLFVRSRIDISVENNKVDHPGTAEEIFLRSIKQTIFDKLNASRIVQTKNDVFLVSSRNPEKYDFKILCDALQNLLNCRGEALREILTEIVKKELDQKKENIKDKFIVEGFLAAVYGFIPIPFFQTSINSTSVRKMRRRCLKEFHIDEDSLAKISIDLGCTEEDLKQELDSYTTVKYEYDILTKTEDSRLTTLGMYSKYLIPVVGSFFSAYNSVLTIEECLDKLCKTMAEDDCKLVEKSLDNLEKDIKFTFT